MSNFDKTLGFLEGRQEQANRIAELEQSLAHARQQLPALLDELEPAWREAYSDPLNLVRVLQAKAQEATDVFHERQQREAAEAARDDYKGRNEAEYYRNEELNELLSRTARLGYEEAQQLTERAEAAEAERETAIEAGLNADGRAFTLQQLAAKLLALAVEQRRALGLIDEHWPIGPGTVAHAALATDLDALVAEAETLGIRGKIDGQEKTEALREQPPA
jgi:hypothetical protein